ncbi:putative F-box-like domain protein, partial [Rhizoctonia solani 123E]
PRVPYLLLPKVITQFQMDMINELDVATQLLNDALDRYTKACSNIREHCQLGIRAEPFSPELTDRVLQELSLATSYETEIQYPKAVASWANNLTSATRGRSINSLPVEILVRIFTLVCTMRPCPRSTKYIHTPSFKQPTFIKNPVVLSHVCSHWRHIAINSGNLWSHIDLVPHQFHVKRLSMRANTYLARASQSLLEIHIEDPTSLITISPKTNKYSKLIEFLAAVAARTWSMTIIIQDKPHKGGLFYRILSVCLNNCVPGTLTQLSIAVPSDSADPNLTGEGGLWMELPEATAEALWLPVTVLRLKNFFPYLSSNMFHGLEELYLVSDSRTIAISELDLVLVLTSNPKLRVFQISFDIVDYSDNDTPVAPIHLDYLERLLLKSHKPQLDIFLRLIAPGSRPLSLSIRDSWSSSRESPPAFGPSSEIGSFFARSNVTQLVANGFSSYSRLEELLSMAPSVRILALVGCRCSHVEGGDISSPTTLDELYITVSTRFGSFAWSCLEQMVQKYSVCKLTLWWYDFRFGGYGSRGLGNVPDNLYTVCPRVTVLSDKDPDPIQKLEWA